MFIIEFRKLTIHCLVNKRKGKERKQSIYVLFISIRNFVVKGIFENRGNFSNCLPTHFVHTTSINNNVLVFIKWKFNFCGELLKSWSWKPNVCHLLGRTIKWENLQQSSVCLVLEALFRLIDFVFWALSCTWRLSFHYLMDTAAHIQLSPWARMILFRLQRSE